MRGSWCIPKYPNADLGLEFHRTPNPESLFTFVPLVVFLVFHNLHYEFLLLGVVIIIVGTIVPTIYYLIFFNR